MDTRQIKLKQKIVKSLGIAKSDSYFSYEVHDVAPFQASAQALMHAVPPSFGSCVMLSCAWASYLKDHFSIPAIVVAGDLKISGKTIFKYNKKLPEPSAKGKIVRLRWNGHCWIEINGYIGDLSIFRTAYAINDDSILKSYIINRFGHGRGAFLSKIEDIPYEMQYIPKDVLKNSQVNMFTASLGYQLEQGI